MKASSREFVVSVAVALLLVVPTAEATAHQLEVKHRAIVTFKTVAADHRSSAEVILLMEVPPGVRAARLRVEYDLDHDGELNPAEALMLSGDLGAETVGGYVLRRDGAPQIPAAVKSAAAFMEGGGIAVAILLDYPLASIGALPTRLEVDVLKTPGGGTPFRSKPLTVELQVAGAKIAASSHPIASDAPVLGPVELSPGQPGAWVELTAGGEDKL